MANIFNRQSAAAPQLSPRAALEGKYSSARYNLLGVVLFTIVNIVILFIDTESYFLFSAFLPYYISTLGLLFSGKLPAEYYEGVEDFVAFPDTVMVVALVIAAVILIAYLLCFIFSNKNRVGWLVAALVLFGIDTAAYILLIGIDFSAILDILFHVWVLYYLVAGILAYNKLKNLPEDAPIEAADFTVSETVTEEPAAEAAPVETVPAEETAPVEASDAQE